MSRVLCEDEADSPQAGRADLRDSFCATPTAASTMAPWLTPLATMSTAWSGVTSWRFHLCCAPAPESAPEELVGDGVQLRAPLPEHALSEPVSPLQQTSPSKPAGSRPTPPREAPSRRSPSVMALMSTMDSSSSRLRSRIHEMSTTALSLSHRTSCSSRFEGMVRSVEEGAVRKFLQEHRFSGIDHCHRESRWPLSRLCCPLSLAAERGDVTLVLLLLRQ
ncbi:unnamed protein product, partial [Prorocentrum cordatum]